MTNIPGARRILPGLAAALLATTTLTALPLAQTAAQTAQAQATRSYSIPAGPLGAALTAFGETSGLRLLVSSEMLAGKQAAGVSGQLTAEQALQRLLTGTGLVYRFTGDNTVTVVEAPKSGDAVMLPPMTVQGQGGRPAETAWSAPANPLVAKRSASSTKTDTSILETPQAVSVITREQMQAQAIQGIEEVSWYSAGIVGGVFGPDPRSDWMLVRGFKPGKYLDGLPVVDGVWTGGTRSEPFALEKLEVLKGPSSALYGQISPGGMVNMISKRPTETPVNEVELTYGSFDRYQGAFDIGGALSENGKVLYRLNGLARTSDSYVDYVFDDRIFLAPSVSIKASDQTTLTLLARYQWSDTMIGSGFLPSIGTLYPNPNGQIPINRFTGEPDYDKYEKTSWSLGYALEHELNNTWMLRQNFRYAEAEVDHRAIGAFGFVGGSDTTITRYFYAPHENSRMTTVDNQAQASFATGAVQHVALGGVDLRMSNNKLDQTFAFGAPPLNVYNPVYGLPMTIPDPNTRNEQQQNQVGVYLQDQMKLGQWGLTLSGRHDWVETDYKDFLAETRLSQNDSAFSGRAAVNYLFDNGVAPYVAYSRSFEPVMRTSATGDILRPTEGEQYEVGIKYQPPGSNSLLTAAVYDLTQQNVTTQDPATMLSRQTGEINVKGLELEGRLSLTRELSMLAAYSYTDSEVTESLNPAFLGKRIQQVPEHQASVWMDYTFAEGDLKGLGAGLGARYFGTSYGAEDNVLTIPSYMLFDGAIHYDLNETWRFQLNGQNLFDKEYVSACNTTNWCYYGYPRTVTLTARMKW